MQQPPQMRAMIADAKPLLDQRRDAAGGPQVGVETRAAGALQEQRLELLALVLIQAALRHMLRLGRHRLRPGALRRSLPGADRLAADAQRRRHVLHLPACRQQRQRPQTPPLQFLCRPWWSHPTIIDTPAPVVKFLTHQSIMSSASSPPAK